MSEASDNAWCWVYEHYKNGRGDIVDCSNAALRDATTLCGRRYAVQSAVTLRMTTDESSH